MLVTPSRTITWLSMIVAGISLKLTDFDASTVETRASSGGKYTSLTCTINATSKEQLDALYRELSAHPMVKVVL